MFAGGWIGLLIGAAFCGVLTIIVFIVSKKEGASVDSILQTLSDEQKNSMMNMTYEKAKKKDMFTSKGLVTSVSEEGEKVKAVLMFYMEEHQSFYTRKVKLTKDDAKNKGIVAGAFVPVLMKYDKDMHYYDFKKLL